MQIESVFVGRRRFFRDFLSSGIDRPAGAESIDLSPDDEF
jgi:hypothetical protein